MGFKKTVSVIAVIAAVFVFVRAEKNIEKVKNLLETNRSEEAVVLLTNLEIQYPENKEISALKGIALMRLKKPNAKAAITLLSGAVDLYKNDSTYSLELCRAYKILTPPDFDKSLMYCKKAVKINSDNYKNYKETGLTYYQMGNPKHAVSYFKKALKKNKEDYTVQYYLAKSYIALGKHKKALTSLKQAELLALSAEPVSYEYLASINREIADVYTFLQKKKTVSPILAEKIKSEDRKLKPEERIKKAADQKRELSPIEKIQLSKCVEKARDLYKQKELLKSQEQYKICLNIQPADIDSRISMAGIMLLREDFENAKKHFNLSLEFMPHKTALSGYCHSKLGDIAMEDDNLTDAKKHFNEALKLNPADVNSQIGLGKYYEMKHLWNEAYTEYIKASLLDPGNIKANEGIRRLKPYIMADDEMLKDLKERHAVESGKTELTEDDKMLFYKIHQAEQLGAVDYIKANTGIRTYNGYIFERRKDNAPLTLHITYKGFQVYRNLISRSAVKDLRKKGIGDKYLFMLTDKQGRKIFDRSMGLLTYDGFNAYYKMLQGKTSYVIAKSGSSASGMTLAVDDTKVKELLREGFIEISLPEYIWIRKATDCSEPTLLNELDLKIVKILSTVRYFIDKTGLKKDKGMFHTLVGQYREGDYSLTNKHSGFFGSGNKKQKVCIKDGTLNPVLF